MSTIKVEYETDAQLHTLNALVQSFEQGNTNIDKFLLWVMRNYDVGGSLCLHILKNGRKEKSDASSDKCDKCKDLQIMRDALQEILTYGLNTRYGKTAKKALELISIEAENRRKGNNVQSKG